MPSRRCKLIFMLRISKHAAAAAVIGALPAFGDYVVTPFLGPVVDFAAGAVTAGIAAHAVARVAKKEGASTRALLRASLGDDGSRAGSAARAILRVACGLDSPLSVFARLPALRAAAASLLGRCASACIPGADVFVRGVRAGSGAVSALLFVRAIEEDARRVCAARVNLDRAMASLIDLPEVFAAETANAA